MAPLTFDIFGYLLLLVYILLAYKGTKVIYRLYFSPLAGFPGPRLAAATSLYEFYFDVLKGGQFMFELDRLHDKYGPVLRINPHEIHIRDPSYYDTVYGGPLNKKDRLPSFTQTGLPLSSFETAPHGLHRERRKLLSPFLSTQSVTALQPVIQEKVDLVCGHMSRRIGTGEFFDLHSLFASFAADVLSAYVFGPANCYAYLDRVEVTDEWKRNVNSLFETLILIRHLPFLYSLAYKIPTIASWVFPPFSWIHPFTGVRVVIIWHVGMCLSRIENQPKCGSCACKTGREIDNTNYSLQRESTWPRKRLETPARRTVVFNNCRVRCTVASDGNHCFSSPLESRDIPKTQRRVRWGFPRSIRGRLD